MVFHSAWEPVSWQMVCASHKYLRRHMLTRGTLYSDTVGSLCSRKESAHHTVLMSTSVRSANAVLSSSNGSSCLRWNSCSLGVTPFDREIHKKVVCGKPSCAATAERVCWSSPPENPRAFLMVWPTATAVSQQRGRMRHLRSHPEAAAHRDKRFARVTQDHNVQ